VLTGPFPLRALLKCDSNQVSDLLRFSALALVAWDGSQCDISGSFIFSAS
jgi:hypothetical protein